jgi:hypothetical protein
MSPMPDRVAGHLFVDTPRGEACAECGKLWMDVLDHRERWVPAALGIAHNDGGGVGLTIDEVAELNRKLERIWNAGMRF